VRARGRFFRGGITERVTFRLAVWGASPGQYPQARVNVMPYKIWISRVSLRMFVFFDRTAQFAGPTLTHPCAGRGDILPLIIFSMFNGIPIGGTSSDVVADTVGTNFAIQ
jgi:hypothetical protein